MALVHSPGFVRGFFHKSPPWVIAVAVTVTMLAAMNLIYVQTRERGGEDPTIAIRMAPAPEPSIFDEALPEPFIRTVPPDVVKELIPLEFDVFLPTSEPDQVDLTQPIGDPGGEENSSGLPNASSSIGAGSGPGHRANRPSALSGRSKIGDGLVGKGRLPLGVPISTQKAVFEGLCWLVRHQSEDGSWGAEAFVSQCGEDRRCASDDAAFSAHYDEGLTGLALLCFLGAGLGHDSNTLLVDPVRAREHDAGEVVKRGLRWLVDRQKEDGSFSAVRPFMYCEALATLALTEAYGLTGNRYWRAPAQRGVDFLVRAQKRAPDGPPGNRRWGWRYLPYEPPPTEASPVDALELDGRPDPSESDVSVTCWVVMALKSAQMAGLVVPQEALDGALAYVKWATGPNGLVGYLEPSGAGLKVSGIGDEFQYHVAAMSALGACVRIFVEHDPDDPFLELAAKQIASDLPALSKDRLSVDYYYWYYGSLALNQIDGPQSPRHTGRYWDPWEKAMVGSLLELQDERESSCTRGAWLVPDRWSYAGGALYATAINVLTLEVYYRYPNAFGGGRELSGERAGRPPRRPR